MAEYDYKSGKKRILEIINNKLEVIEGDKLPNDEQLTYINAYYCWVTGIFIDIRDSSNLFSNEDNEIISKVIRSFTSEVIEILRNDDLLREIGIRGDCVYGIYTTPSKGSIFNILDMAFYINTFMEMLKKILSSHNFPLIKVGIGLSTSKELVVKAGRKDTGINNKVWIGDAVSKASNLSSLGNKNECGPIVISEYTYNNIIDELIKNNGEKARSWFTRVNNNEYGVIYHGSIIKLEFNQWIKDDMPS